MDYFICWLAFFQRAELPTLLVDQIRIIGMYEEYIERINMIDYSMSHTLLMIVSSFEFEAKWKVLELKLSFRFINLYFLKNFEWNE